MSRLVWFKPEEIGQQSQRLIWVLFRQIFNVDFNGGDAVIDSPPDRVRLVVRIRFGAYFVFYLKKAQRGSDEFNQSKSYMHISN